MSRLPSDWQVLTLGDVAKWSSGGTPKAGTGSYYGGEIPWAIIGDLNDGVVSSTAGTITAAGLEESSAKWVSEGAVLIAMYGSIGKLGIAGRPLTTNQAIAAAHPTDLIEAKYLFLYLLSQRHELGRAGKGAAQRNIGQGVLKGWPIPVPPLDEQRRIVGILEGYLSRLDAADRGMGTSALRLAAYRQALRQQAVDAPSSPAVSLARLISRVEAGKSFGGAAPPADLDEWGIIKVSAMTWGEFRAQENKRIPAGRADVRYEIRPGDLLVSRANTAAYVGASVLVGDVRPGLLLSDKSLRLVPRPGVNVEWLNEVLQSPRARRQITALATGTKESMRNISQKALLSVYVPNTSEGEQAAVIEAIEKGVRSSRGLERALDAARRRSANLRRSLLAAAFSGRLTGRPSDLDLAEDPSAMMEPEAAPVVEQEEALLW